MTAAASPRVQAKLTVPAPLVAATHIAASATQVCLRTTHSCIYTCNRHAEAASLQLSVDTVSRSLLGLVPLTAETLATVTVPKVDPYTDPTPSADLSRVTSWLWPAAAALLSLLVKATELATLMEPWVTESMLTLASVFSLAKMLFSKVAMNCT